MIQVSVATGIRLTDPTFYCIKGLFRSLLEFNRRDFQQYLPQFFFFFSFFLQMCHPIQWKHETLPSFWHKLYLKGLSDGFANLAADKQFRSRDHLPLSTTQRRRTSSLVTCDRSLMGGEEELTGVISGTPSRKNRK